jgi:hypothetical protein
MDNARCLLKQSIGNDVLIQRFPVAAIWHFGLLPGIQFLTGARESREHDLLGFHQEKFHLGNGNMSVT